MIRALILMCVLFASAQALPRIGAVPDIVSVASAGTEASETSPLFAQNEASSDPAANRAIDLDERQRSRFRYLMLGYGLIWLILGAFLVSLNRRIGQVGQEIGELSGRLEDSKRSLPGRSS